MPKLTDKQKKHIIADRVNGMSFRKIAAKYHVCEATIRNVCKADSTITQKCAQKKEQNTLDMLQYMESQKSSIQKLLTDMIEAMHDPYKLAKANVRDLATAYGIIYDKIMQSAPRAGDELLQTARDILGEIDGVIR